MTNPTMASPADLRHFDDWLRDEGGLDEYARNEVLQHVPQLVTIRDRHGWTKRLTIDPMTGRRNGHASAYKISRDRTSTCYYIDGVHCGIDVYTYIDHPFSMKMYSARVMFRGIDGVENSAFCAFTCTAAGNLGLFARLHADAVRVNEQLADGYRRTGTLDAALAKQYIFTVNDRVAEIGTWSRQFSF